MILLIYSLCAQSLYKRDALLIYNLSKGNEALANIL